MSLLSTLTSRFRRFLPSPASPRRVPGSSRRAYGGGAGGGSGFWGPGYDAVNQVGNRRSPGPRTMTEDLELRDLARRQLSTTHRDLVRNFAIAGWMVRKHLDYVSTFHFRSKSGDKGLDRDINDRIEWWERPENCDTAGRHSLPDLRRMWEALRTIDGDCLINRVKTGRVQTIEGDRIQTYGGIPFEQLGITDPTYVQNGVWTNEYGRAKAFMVFRRPPQWTGLVWDRMIPARFADLFGYYAFRADQVRGISPLAAAANGTRDIYEAFDYALLKAKAAQFLGFQVTRAASDEFKLPGDELHGADEIPETGENGEPIEPRYQMEFAKGPTLLEMDPGDKIETIESNTPSTEFQGFTAAMIMLVLKALDIPFSFYDESHTNFNGSRMAGIAYEQSAKTKRHRMRMLLNKLTAWRLGLFIADGELTLPAKMEPADLRWEWSALGQPWFNPLQEVSASIASINAGLASPQQIHKEKGTDFESTIDEIAQARDYAANKNVILSTALASVAADDPNKNATKTEDQNVVEETDDEDEEEETHGKGKSPKDASARRKALTAAQRNRMWGWG